MLDKLFQDGLQLLSMIALGRILWGVFVLIGVFAGGRGPIDMVKGAALIAPGVYPRRIAQFHVTIGKRAAGVPRAGRSKSSDIR